MIHTNRCKHCNKPREEHYMGGACEPKYGEWDSYYLDSGLAALDAHKEELHEAMVAIEKLCDNQNPTHEAIWRIAYGILNQIEKEK